MLPRPKGFQITFAEFWRMYLDAHRHPATRGAHYFATLVGIVSTILAIQFGEFLYMVGGIAMSYAIAVGSHWLIEHNQPLIKVNPFYGAVADLRMCWLALTNGLRAEYERLGLIRSDTSFGARRPAE